MYNPRFLNEGAELLDDYFDTPSESNYEQDNREEIEVQKPRRLRYKDFYKSSKTK